MSTLDLKYEINKIIIIQRFIKNIISIKNKLIKELDFIISVIYKTTQRIDISYSYNIINNNEYKTYMNELDEIMIFYNKIPKLTIKNINKLSKYRLILKISEIKIKCINCIQNVGSMHIKDILKLTLNIDLNCNRLDDKYKDYVQFYDKIFNPTGYDIYESINKDNISFTLYNKTNNITLSSFQINYPSCNKLSKFTDSLIIKIYGAKLYFPFKSKLLVIYGYFIKDNLNIEKNNLLHKNKNTELLEKFNQLDIPDCFKFNYLKQISLRDFIILSQKDICNYCIEAYSDLNKLKQNNISIIVKDFLISKIEKQRYYLTILVLDENDYDSHYIAYLLYDLVSSNILINTNNIDPLYNSFNWYIQKLFKKSKKNVDKIDKDLSCFNEDQIPYEKRINLMKASNQIKYKALNKLKELNSSKGGETNAKVEQYIDGLLKIPFGIYKEESITHHKNICYNKINKNNIKIINILSEIGNNYKLCNNSNLFIDNLQNLIKNFKKNNILMINIFIKSINKLVENYNINTELNNISNFDIYLNSLSKTNLKDICDNLKIKKTGNKATLIQNILKTKISILIFNKIFTNYTNSINYNIDIRVLSYYNDIVEIIYDNKNIVNEYKILQKKYFQNVNYYLDKYVYGLMEPKRQIIRIIAQWINGTNDGYVFGFEGPPGTGKTTLAKKGISMCLQDINGETRPFIFIALGGSSNGSTLEGHNYTYVGSTWGKIVEAIIESKCMNPIIYIDELDKISKTEHGKEIVGILTHLTDPSQNEEFNDKYFSGIKFDISKCLIIFSYNDPSLVDRILLDRIHRIKITHLNKIDKIHVCKKHILPEICYKIGLDKEQIIITDDILIHLIDIYTYEAGARKLKEKLFEIIREINLRYLNDQIELPFNITKKFIDNLFINYPKTQIKLINNEPKVGLVNGLYATSEGIGGITIIECYKNYSNNHLSLELTGKQGDVMKESMKVANTIAWNILHKDIKDRLIDKNSEKFGIHIHCPAGATPKDGPSAGTAITLSILSLLTGIKINNEFGITGEIDLNGNCLKIGGLESKIDGAKAAGIKVVLCPISNKEDLDKIRNRTIPPEDNNFKVILIKNIYDAIHYMMIFNNNDKIKYIKELSI